MERPSWVLRLAICSLTCKGMVILWGAREINRGATK